MPITPAYLCKNMCVKWKYIKTKFKTKTDKKTQLYMHYQTGLTVPFF